MSGGVFGFQACQKVVHECTPARLLDRSGGTTHYMYKAFHTNCVLTSFNILAVLVHVGAAGFSQDDVIPEVPDLHLDEVEHLLLALGVVDFLQLLCEASEDSPTAGLLDGN